MKYRSACLGLEGILENQAFAEFMSQNLRCTVPGFGCEYELRTFNRGVEFSQCYKGSLTGLRPAGMAIHFGGSRLWTLVVDAAMDKESVAHEYMVHSKGKNNPRFPVRVVSPDVLADIQQGDALYGQVAAFIEKGTVGKDCGDGDGTFAAEGDHAVRLGGKILSIEICKFEFEDIVRKYLRLDIETNLGRITGAALRENLNAMPEIGDSIFAKAYISMDVGVPHKSALGAAEHEEPAYPGLHGSKADCDYQFGCVRNHKNAMGILAKANQPEEAFRFGRCCADRVQFTDASGQVQILGRWAVVEKLNTLFADAKKAEPVLTITDKDGASCFQGGILLDAGVYLTADTNEAGLVERMTLLPAEEYGHDNALDRYLLGILGNALCHNQVERLCNVMGENCMYQSEYAGEKRHGLSDVIGFIREVNGNLSEATAYRYELVLANEEIMEEAQEGLPDIFKGEWCGRLYQAGVLAAVMFLRHDAHGNITHILLSRDGRRLKSFAGKFDSKAGAKESEAYKAVDAILRQRFGEEDTIFRMRHDKITAPDEEGAYIWQKADAFIRNWFRENKYRLDNTELFDDCVGYACTRRGEAYAVYVYAYGERKTAMLDGEYCAKLREHGLSKNRTVLILYLHVTAEENDKGETDFFVGRYNSKEDAPEVWKLGWIGDRSVFLFYPRKEIDDLISRFEAAYNGQRVDILKVLFSDNIELIDMKSNGYRNEGAYDVLAHCYKLHGRMKTGYIRFNDAVYCEVPYIDEYCYVHFSVNREDRIDKISLAPMNETDSALYERDNFRDYRELYKTDHALMHHPMDDVPGLEKVECLPPSPASRFSMLLRYANGETRRYDAQGDFGDEEVVTWLGNTFTDKIFCNGRISSNVYARGYWLRKSYPNPHAGIEFINGAGIFGAELYHGSYPVGEFSYRDGAEIFLLNDFDSEDSFAVGHIDDMDPANPLYLFDKSRKIARTLPAQYQQTPMVLYPYCGGYSEGLLMVSTMGELDLQYFHEKDGCAGMWGWLDTDFKTVIAPKYVFAENFQNGRAIVCKGEWSTVEKDGALQYWCENESWGVINQQEQELVPCRFDELFKIEGTARLYFVHEGGWEKGHYAIYDVQEQKVILELDFHFGMAYMFNECFVAEGDILVFVNHLSGKGEDLLYAYDLHSGKYLLYAESHTGRTLNGESRVVVNKDGQDIIVF